MSDAPSRVVHVLDALTDAGPGLWGKERVVAHLLDAQRASGFDPSLAVFVDCSLAALARERGFAVTVLSRAHRRVPVSAVRALRRSLADGRPAIVHSHEYKANVVARLLRRTGAPMRALVSTSHAWFDDTRMLAAYNRIDRLSAAASDVVTVADRHMALQFPRGVRAEFVANGVPASLDVSPDARRRIRATLNVAGDVFVAGYVARTSIAKGIGVFCDAARASAAEPIVWCVAGSGEREDLAREAGLTNLRYLGFVSDTDGYRAAIDCFVQASYVEGLSISLLEAMRAGLPIVATDAGSTRSAIRDGIDGLIVAPGDAGAIARAVATLATDRPLRERLGRAARERFVSHFSIERQVAAFGTVYAMASEIARAGRR